MAKNSDWVLRRRQDAWQFGRDLAADLTEQYRQRYRLSVAPAPAIIVGELLTDFLGAELHYDPLPSDRYAQTRWVDGHPVVSVNALTNEITGVKDVAGVERVATWHELIHVVEDGDMAPPQGQVALPGLGEPPAIVCYRDYGVRRNPTVTDREVRAEEAGRAASVSIWALERVPQWQELFAYARQQPNGEITKAWRLLYRCAEAIGVNISALVKQLQLEDRLVVVRGSSPARLWLPISMWEGGEE